MNVIFLDVDGVLNCVKWFQTEEYQKTRLTNPQEVNPFNIKNLSEIYNSCDDCKIVMISTWKILNDPEDKSCYEQWMMLINSLNVYGMTIDDSAPDTLSRPLDVKTYLDSHKDIDNFVIMDDDCSFEDYEEYNIGSHLVQTHFYVNDIKDGGIQEKHIKLAKEILRR